MDKWFAVHVKQTGGGRIRMLEDFQRFMINYKQVLNEDLTLRRSLKGHFHCKQISIK